jgi:hypothetical protein
MILMKRLTLAIALISAALLSGCIIVPPRYHHGDRGGYDRGYQGGYGQDHGGYGQPGRR